MLFHFGLLLLPTTGMVVERFLKIKDFAADCELIWVLAPFKMAFISA